MRRLRGASFVVLAAIGVVGVARAEPAVDIQLLQPSAGRSSALTIPEPELPAHGTLRLALTGNYARQIWMREISCPPMFDPKIPICQPGTPLSSRVTLVPHMTQFELSAAIALFERLQLGAVLPVAATTRVDDFDWPRLYLNGYGIGDLRLSVDVPLLTGKTAIGASLVISVPIGQARTFAAERYPSVRPALVLRRSFGPVSVSLLAAYRARQRVEFGGLLYDDEVELAAGARVRVLPALELRGEFRARIGIGTATMQWSRRPGELDGALVLRPMRGREISLGGGAGVWPGAAAYGAPLFRLLGSVAVEIETVRCGYGPEDHDGVRDLDSCRDPDDDHDGIPDERDACPLDPEDRDGFADEDGCPDPDNDADGVRDSIDRCPDQSEDRDGFEDDDGCPEPDNDGDGFMDALDACPLAPEDRDGFEDGDGCPEPGPETLPATEEERQLLGSERVYFTRGRDAIRLVSRSVLDQVAATIRGMRPGLKVIVEGHADDGGSPAHNLDLSHRRARAVVEYLQGRGVPRERLDYVGYGLTRPIGPRDSPEGRALNRRVEFSIGP